MAYRVDNIPWWLKPFYLLWAFTVVVFSQSVLFIIRATCKITVKQSLNPPPKQAIYAIWHEDLMLYFSSFKKYNEPYFWLNHPIWYMKPVHTMLYQKGVKGIALGSTGHGGKQALEEVIEKLKAGHNTLVAIDGPAGPPKQAKYGVLEMSLQTGLPIVAITYTTEKEWRLGGWDKKRMPNLFTKWTAIYHAPIYVTQENYKDGLKALENALG